MATKACKHCRALFEGSTCPSCGSTEHVDSFKGRVDVLNAEQSQIAHELKLTKKGSFAIRLR